MAVASTGYVLVSCLMRPGSRGSVNLASGHLQAAALIDPKYLAEPADLDLLVERVSLAREAAIALRYYGRNALLPR